MSLGQTSHPGAAHELGECNLWASSGPCGCPASHEAPRIGIDLGVSFADLAVRAARFDPDVLVLTHADGDHIGGFEKFCAAGGSPREIWVPYEWGLVWQAMAAVQLARSSPSRDGHIAPAPPGRWGAGRDLSSDARRQRSRSTLGRASTRRIGPEVIDRLGALEDGASVKGEKPVLSSVLEVPWSERRQSPTEEYRCFGPYAEGRLDRAGEHRPEAAEKARPVTQGVGGVVFAVRAVAKILADLGEEELHSVRKAIGDVIVRERVASNRKTRPAATGTATRVAKEITAKGEQVCRILDWAAARGTDVRYFSTDAVAADQSPAPWRVAGEPGFITVVNALEVELLPAFIERSADTFMRLVTLTTYNRRALVTYLWERQDGPSKKGVLVWSDSAGETCLAGNVHTFDLVPWSSVRLMTAPHHGSSNASHDAVWEAWAGERRRRGEGIPVIVSGGKPSAATSKRFLESAPRLRSCTYCRHEAANAIHRDVSAIIVNRMLFLQPNCLDGK